MRPRQSFFLKPRGAVPVVLAAFLFACAGSCGTAAQAFDAESETSDDIEHPADVAPGDAEMAPEDGLIEPDELDPETLMRPEMKQGGQDGPPPRSAEESKQDKLSPDLGDLPLPTPQEKPKMLAELYDRLGKARNAEAALPIVEAIEALWRFSGSDTIDLLMHRAERFAQDDDLDLALKILDATVDIDPDQAEAWHLRAKVHYFKKDYGAAIADLRRALDRDPNHFAAMNDLGVVLEATGAKKEALEAYRKALAINPFLPESTKQAVEQLGREVEGQEL